MKRTVNAWAVLYRGRLRDVVFHDGLFTYRARQVIDSPRKIPCTITYDDGKRPAKRAKEKQP